MKHPWVTKRGQWPLKSVKEMIKETGKIDEDDVVLPDLMATHNVLDVPRQVACHQYSCKSRACEWFAFSSHKGASHDYRMDLISGRQSLQRIQMSYLYRNSSCYNWSVCYSGSGAIKTVHFTQETHLAPSHLFVCAGSFNGCIAARSPWAHIQGWWDSFAPGRHRNTPDVHFVRRGGGACQIATDSWC